MPKPTVTLKVSKHPDPSKPNNILISSNITVPADKEPPAKHVIFLVDNNKVSDRSTFFDGRPIAYVNQLTSFLIQSLAINKDNFSLVQFHTRATCPVPKQVFTGKQWGAFHALGNSTNIEAGFDGAISQIDQQNLDNTLIVLLLAGPITEGKRDAKDISTKLKQKFGDKSVRVLPIGIGDDYPIDFMRQLGLETGFRGLIHLDDNADPKTAFTQVKPYLLPRTKPLTVSVSFGGSSLNEELGSIECNSPASTVFEFTLPPGKQLQEIEIQCTTKMGKEENVFVSNNNNAEFNSEIIARYYTQRYLNILEKNNPPSIQITELKQLRAEIENLKHDLQIKTVYDTIYKTINSLESDDISAARTAYTTSYTGYTRVAGAGTKTQVSQKELVNVVGYDQATNKLLINADYFKAVSEDVDLNDIKTNGDKFISFDAAIQNREAIIFGRADIYNFARQLIVEVNRANSPSLHNRLEVLCAIVRKQFHATNVDDKVKAYLQQNPSSQLKLNDGSTLIPCISLRYFQEVGAAVCRHYAPFTALSILHLIDNNMLPPGTVRIYRGTADNQKAHSWVHYHPKNKMNEHLLFLIDSTNPGQKVFVFDLRKIKQKEKDVNLENAILNYRQRGLDGLLSEMLNKHYQLNISHIQLSENIRVSAELIQQIHIKIEAEKSASADKMTSKTEQDLKNQDVIDSISDDIIIEPVKTDDRIDDKKKDRKHVYDRDFIATWLRHHDMSPNTSLKLLSKNLLPAYEEVNRINGILARHLGIVLPEQHAQTSVAIQAQPQLSESEEVSLSKLNNRDQQVQTAIQKFEAKLGLSANLNLSSASRVATSGISREVSAAPAPVVLPSTASPSVATSGSSDETSAVSESAGGIESVMSDERFASIRWKQAVPYITDTYKQQCGFFHSSSSDSVELLKAIVMGTEDDEIFRTGMRRILIERYLNDFNNYGKRLYDILLEQKIIIEQALQKHSDSVDNPIWLNGHILYLIQNKYAKNRGFKFFGRTCEASSNLLNYLIGSDSLMQKQQAIENYLNAENDQSQKANQGKRLFIILSEMKAKFASGADQNLSRRNDL